MASFSKPRDKRGFWRSGEMYVWATGGALTLTLMTTVLLLLVIVVNGLAVLWPSPLLEITLSDGEKAMGEVFGREAMPEGEGDRVQLKVGNRELYSLDFRWFDEADIVERTYPEDAIALEREEYGNFYGYLDRLDLTHVEVEGAGVAALRAAWHEVIERESEVEELADAVAGLNGRMERINNKLLELEYERVPETDPAYVDLMERKAALLEEQKVFDGQQNEILTALKLEQAIFRDANGREKAIPLLNLVDIYQPNAMSVPQKMGFYMAGIWGLLTERPRESNTEGGLYPAIFGTVMLIFIMSVLSFPLGVLAGVYLREYAKSGPMVRAINIAVNNLAGIPSIVYGIFGLGFFIYGVGGTIDTIFYPERLPAPTFGKGGILWASLTLGLLTIPVVIVATDEALSAVPKGVREASYALGSTRLQMLVRCILPMASPGIMTGFILAMARAAGEVAPLMITGVVKLAQSLPVDGNFPFVHLDRQFMHLGFHIYDVGFQSPNVEAAKPMVYLTTLLLVLVVLVMSSVAIYLRRTMRKRYSSGAI